MSLQERNVAVILLIDDQDRVLLQHRSDDAPAYPGIWGLFGGGIDPGESPDEAVKRESWEELRAEFPEDPVRFYEAAFTAPPRYGMRYCYTVRWSEVQKESLELHEGKDWGWFSFDDALQLDLAGHIPIVIEKLKEYWAKPQVR